MSDMTNAPESATIPTWTLSDRLRKSREAAGFDQIHIAERLAKKRTTVSNWERGRNRPDELALRAWAHETRVPLEWLKWGSNPEDTTGDAITSEYPPGPGERPIGEVTPVPALQTAA